MGVKMGEWKDCTTCLCFCKFDFSCSRYGYNVLLDKKYDDCLKNGDYVRTLKV